MVRRRDCRGVSFMEALIGIMILGTTLAGLLSGLTLIGSIARSGREEAQATYIASETLDTMRLYSWNQLTNAAFLPSTFKVTYGANGLEWEFDQPQGSIPAQPTGLTGLLGNPLNTVKSLLNKTIGSSPTGAPSGSGSADGPNSAPEERSGSERAYADLVFHGTLAVTESPVTEGYRDQIKMLTVTLEWESGGRVKEAKMSTLFTRYGLQGQLVN